MPLSTIAIPLSEPQLPYLARWLLAHPFGEPPLGLADALVLLPAARPCATLTHALLDASGRESVVLPRITTPTAWALQAAAMLGLDAAGEPPAKDLRSLLLARRLVDAAWGGAAPEAAPALADDLVALFDTVRSYRLEELLLGDTDPERLLALENPAAAELLSDDIQQIRAAWRLYRTAVPHDETDLLVAVTAELERCGWPGAPPRLVAMAGFADVSPLVAGLLRSAAGAADAYLFQPGSDDPLSRLVLATYRDAAVLTHPLQPSARVAAMIAGSAGAAEGTGTAVAADTAARTAVVVAAPAAAARDEDVFSTATRLNDRLAALGDAVGLLGPDGTVALVPCDDPEHESREVVRRVVERLAAGPPTPTICIATGDRQLAARVVARLRDAGIDADDTGGRPLAGLPAGILARAILRSVVSGLMFDQLLELLTQPWVDLRPAGRGHKAWTLKLEKRIRANLAAVAGRDALRRLAVEYDNNTASGGMTAFAGKIDAALAQLWSLHDGRRHAWRDHLAALRTVWTNLAPEHSLAVVTDDAEQPHDLTALAQLLDDLTAQATRPGALAPTTLGDFAADFMRLLAARTVRRRRSAFLPVQVMGLIEARLERFDLLILAGMREDVLPGRRRRPLWLSDRACAAVGVPTWRERDALDAELFLRLLHNGDEVVVTWPTEVTGQPVLPSPHCGRLLLVGDEQPPRPNAATIYLTDPADPREIAAAQAAFAGESPQIPGFAAQPLPRFSYSALASYRDCPYRFLLERGYGLKEEEQVLRAFQSRDYGSLVHDCLALWLDPGGAGWQALARGDAGAAADALAGIAAARFGDGSAELPIRRLWEVAFARAYPALAAWETERFRSWRPLLREVDFTLPLGRLGAWLEREAARQDVAAALPPLDPAAAALEIGGKIDRIDVRSPAAGEPGDGPRALAIIDYKTGALPSVKSILTGEELQVALYALAVAAGGVAELAESSAGGGHEVAAAAYYKVGETGTGFDRPQLDFRNDAHRAVLLAAGRTILDEALAAGRGRQAFPLVPAFTADTTQTRFPCRHCALRGVCRIEERIDAGAAGIDPAVGTALRKLLATRKGT
jgi:ATP-dependent helicase/nuclease subunit B